MKKKDWGNKYVGKKMNFLSIVSVDYKRKRVDGRYSKVCKCVCDCGAITYPVLSLVITGRTTSCGCRRVINCKLKNTKHGLSTSKIYNVYEGMVSRCHDINHQGYKNYGGRGISVCDEWLKDNAIFFNWAQANGYKSGLQLDRTNNNGNYSPDNCRFITISLNLRNTRRNRLITHNGETKTLVEWCETFDIKYSITLKRLIRGWNLEKCISTPNMKIKALCYIPSPNEELILFND